MRETMFDGFEDYKPGILCTTLCKELRHVNFGDIANSIDSVQKHTGRYSLKVLAGSSIGFIAPIISQSSLVDKYGLRIKIDSVPKFDTAIISPGTDMLSAWNVEPSATYCPPSPLGAAAVIQYPFKQFSGLPQNTKWRGKLVPKQTGTYQFSARCDDGFRIKINNIYITSNTGYGVDNLNCDGSFAKNFVTLESNPINPLKGQIYDIEIDAYNKVNAGYFDNFKWKYGCTDYHTITEGCLYPDNYGAISVTRSSSPSFVCSKLDSVQVTGNAVNDSLSLVQGKKMVLGAWVKEGGNDCKCTGYIRNGIEVRFTGATETFDLKTTGNIIEGWQRYEAAILIPLTATAITVRLKNLTSADPVYFDDIRMHPFNANMKSFVYHSSNLRLMSELDENNYASFYEYDDEGTLVRVKKETQNGIKTIKETRSELLKK